MRNMKQLFVGLLAMMAFTSCTKYLDIQPYGRTIPKTAEEFSALLQNDLNAIDEGSRNYIIGTTSSTTDWDLGGGDDFETCLTQQSGRFLPVYVGDFVGSTLASSPYANLYEVIRDCNIVIGNMTEQGTDLANSVMATAYAMRGVAYYQLMRMYCEAPEKGSFGKQLGMPIVTDFNMEYRPIRSTMQQTIDQVESDLQKALEYHSTDKIYLFTADVVKGYMARLYFWTEQWEKALPLAQELLKAYPLLSGDSYKQMIAHPLDKTTNQLISAYRALSTSTSQGYQMTAANIKYRPVSKRFLKCFQNGEDTTDVRYPLCVNVRRQAVKPVFCGMRAAEFKLMEAECYVHLGKEAEALASLNDFRSHRIEGVKPYAMETLPAKNDMEIIRVDAQGKPLTPLMAAILNERRKELFLETDRLFELKRNGTPSFWTAYNGRKYVTAPYMYTFPIPESDIRVTPAIVQNPGYTDLKN